MSKQAWTKEPWHDGRDLVLPDIAKMIPDDYRRASACVNALAGLKPEGVAEAVEAENARLREGNDLYVLRALSLVEQSLESVEGRDAVRKQTGGSAPELVQGILDAIGQRWDDLAEARAQLAAIRAVGPFAQHGSRLVSSQHEWGSEVMRKALEAANGE